MYIYCDWLWLIWLLNAKHKTENYTDFGHFLTIYMQTIKWEITVQNTIKKYKPYAFFGRGFWRQNLFNASDNLTKYIFLNCDTLNDFNTSYV